MCGLLTVYNAKKYLTRYLGFGIIKFYDDIAIQAIKTGLEITIRMYKSYYCLRNLVA